MLRMSERLGPKPANRGVCGDCGRPWHEGRTCAEEYASLPEIPRASWGPDHRADRWPWEENGEDYTEEEQERLRTASELSSKQLRDSGWNVPHGPVGGAL